jgi:cytoskeletal protein CcmA (bactofilin family)
VAANVPPSFSPAPAPSARPRALVDRQASWRESVLAQRWIAKGTAKVAKDVEATAVDLDGVVSVGGQISAGTLRLRGTLEVTGNVFVTESFVVRGAVRASATVRAGSLDSRGSFRTSAALTVDGFASVVGNLEAPAVKSASLRLTGGGRIPGRIDAASVWAELREASDFGTIVAGSVRFHAKVPTIVDKVRFREWPVTIDRIEAEVVDLQGVEVNHVRAPQVVLGRGCHVTQVEGSIVRQHPSSYVGPESRSKPPYGLRR